MAELPEKCIFTCIDIASSRIRGRFVQKWYKYYEYITRNIWDPVDSVLYNGHVIYPCMIVLIGYILFCQLTCYYDISLVRFFFNLILIIIILVWV